MDARQKSKRRDTLQDLMNVLFRRKWVVAGVVLATVIPVTIFVFRIPTEFEAKGKLLVKPGRENIYIAPVGDPSGQRPPTLIQRVGELINSEIQILKSRVLMRRVVEDIQVANLFPGMLPEDSKAAHAAESPPLETAVTRALEKLSASRIKETDVIEVGFQSHDPDMAAHLVNTLVDEYLERHLEVHGTARGYDFFKAQSNQLEQELKSSARRLADFKKKYNLVNFDQLKALTLDKYSEVGWKKTDKDGAIKVSRANISKLKDDLAKMSEHRYVGQDENPEGLVVSQLKLRLSQLEMEKLELQQTYKPDFRLTRIEEEIEKLREMLANEQEEFHGMIRTGVNTAYQKLELQLLQEEAKLEALNAERTEIEKQVVQYGQELERLGRLEPELRALERAVEVNEQNFKLYVTKFEESRVSDAMDAAKMVSVTVLEPATPPLGPIPKNRGLTVLLSLCIAGVAGLGLAFLVEYFDHSFKVPEDIEDNLNVPLLVTIDDLPSGQVSDLEALAVKPAPPLHYQILKTNVAMRAGERGMKTLSVCSPTRGEGASTVALNLAAWLAKDTGSRLVLVDANLRNPSVHSSCKLPASPGFAEVIHEGVGIGEALKQSVIPNLSVLTSGVSPPNPMVVFESPRLSELVESLKSEFDWVIFDCAPADIYPDPILLARRLDGGVLVVEAENKDAEVAVRAKDQLEEAGAKIVGAVLNRRRQIIPQTIYKRL